MQVLSENVQTSKAFYPARPMPWGIRAFHKLFAGLICWPLGFKTDIQNLDRLKELQKKPNGLVMALNHSSLADSATLQRLSGQAGITPVTMASLSMFDGQLFHLPLKVVWPVASRLGLFSINEANPTVERSKAFAQKTLEQAKFPLAIFPEGRVNWNSNQIATCRAGTMDFALKAASAKNRAVNVVPIGISYSYAPKAKKQAEKTLLQLERFAHAQQGKNFPELKTLPDDASLQQRIERLTDWVLAKEEAELGNVTSTRNVTERIKNIRHQKLAKLLEKYESETTGLSPSQNLKNKALPESRQIPELYKRINARQLSQPKPSFWVMLNPWSGRRKTYRELFQQTQADMRQLKALEIWQSCQDVAKLEPSLTGQLTQQMEALHRLQCLITGKRPGIFSVMRNCTAHIQVGEPIEVNPREKTSECAYKTHLVQLTQTLQSQLQGAVEVAKKRTLQNESLV